MTGGDPLVRRLANMLMGLVALAASATIAVAQDVATFYRGKTITLVVGYGPGGGYDIYARLLSRVLGKYIPGNPNVVVQNMPGAGSLRAANYIYRAAAKDGTVIGTFSRNMPVVGLREDPNVQFDPLQFTWLGSASSFANDAYILIARRDAAVKSVEDARRPGGPQLIVGATADTSTNDTPTVLRDMLGFNLKIIPGYADSGQVYMAMERGEIEARTTALSAVLSNKPDWLRPGGPMQVLVVFGRQTRHPNYPDAPLATELAKTPADRRLIEILEVPYKLSRPFAAPPGLPVDRAKALQAAFMAAQEDPELIEEAKRLDIDVSPIGSDEILGLIKKIADTPKDQLKTIEKLIQGG
jgi:tripartite-type tricarboxylate transporter receptor subunit TctC